MMDERHAIAILKEEAKRRRKLEALYGELIATDHEFECAYRIDKDKHTDMAEALEMAIAALKG